MELALQCPFCDVNRVNTAKKLFLFRGFLLFIRYGSTVRIGCRSCVASALQNETALNAVLGWWCFPWGILTPFILIHNICTLLQRADDSLLRSELQKIGIDVDDHVIGTDGWTREQRTMIRAAAHVLRSAMLADGKVDPREMEMAIHILVRLSGDKLSLEEVKLLLSKKNVLEKDPTSLSIEFRISLLKMAGSIFTMDEVVSPKEMAYFFRLGSRLSISRNVAQEILDEILGLDEPDDDEADSNSSELDAALAVFGADHRTSFVEIQKSYRRLMMRYHPDRIPDSSPDRKRLLEKAQEINSAYDRLRRHYEEREVSV